MGNQIVLFLCALFVAGTFCKNARIIGGQLSDIHEFPYIASIRLYSTNELVCAGSIISNKHILTAAHCVFDMKNDFSDMRVFTGSSTLSGIRRTSFFVEKINVHPEFQGQVVGTNKYHRDIAVITVRGSIRFNNVQNKIDLPTADVVDGSDAVICGWGVTRFLNGEYSDQLRKVTVKVIKRSDCKKIFPYPVLRDQVCTFKKGKGSSTGDSGGPVASNGKLIGVVSYNVPLIEDTPEIQSNVFKNLDFIQLIINS